MRLALYLILCLPLALSCKKHHDDLPEDNGCIEQKIVPRSAHSINSADIADVDNLFLTNGVDNSRYHYFKYVKTALQTYYPPYAIRDSRAVMVDQYVNGIRIFNAERVFHFMDGVYEGVNGADAITSSSLAPVANLTLGQVRKLFMDDMKADGFRFIYDRYKDSCLWAEFGYYCLPGPTGAPTTTLIKAWRVTIKNSVYPSEYPAAVYADNNGEKKYYDDGIIVNLNP